MAKTIKCADTGVNCDWGATANTEEELMRKIKEHAKEGHGFDDIPQELLSKVKSSIRDA